MSSTSSKASSKAADIPLAPWRPRPWFVNAKQQLRAQFPKSLPSSWRMVLFGACCVLGLTLLLYSSNTTLSTQLEVGHPSPRRYKAPQDVKVINNLETERNKQAARAQVSPIYRVDPQVTDTVLTELDVWELQPNITAALTERYRSPEGVRPSELKELIIYTSSLVTNEPQRVKDLLTHSLVANAFEDETATREAREAAANAAPIVMKTLLKDQIIVNEGVILTDDHIETLKAAGLYRPYTNTALEQGLRLLGSLFMALLLCIPLAYYAPRLWTHHQNRQMVAFALVLLLTVGLQQFFFLMGEAFLIVPLAALLFAALTTTTTAAAASVWVSLAVACLQPETAFLTLIGGLSGALVASLAAKALNTRTSLLVAGFMGGLAAAVMYLSYNLLLGPLTQEMLNQSSWLLAGGTFAGLLALGVLPLLEGYMGFLTEFKLLELLNPMHPLQQRLLTEAPGTYQHSLIISNLVEQAVTRIGGNALLARVAAMYHDVGKLRRPQFFTENQFGRGNPHDHISPHLSYLIITSHVRDGVDLLRQYNVPEAFEPFVMEHHGTTVLSFFYKKALEESAELDELSFRYAGPRPQSKETAVLMIADAVESASRSLKDTSQGSIRGLIDRIIEQRLQDDQLAECPLNFRDLDIIASTFERAMMATLHRRIHYPSQDEIKRMRARHA